LAAAAETIVGWRVGRFRFYFALAEGFSGRKCRSRYEPRVLTPHLVGT
jgi:hypothetical protein